MPPTNWDKALYNLLVDVFTVGDLHRWIYFNCPVVRDAMPASTVDIAAYAFAFIQHASKQGVFDDAVFESLAKEREWRRADIDAIRRTWRVAVNLAGPSPPRASDPPPAHLDPSHMAITLDRIGQWHGILGECAGPEHLLILVHGDREQDLHLFLRRIKTYVDKECARRHHEFIVEVGRDHSAAVTADDWARQICLASPLRVPILGVALAQSARAMAALFVLEEAGKPLRSLGSAHFAGFAELFETLVPDAFARHPPHNPIRFVLPVEHRDDSRAVREALAQLADRLTRQTALKVLSVKELEFPSLDDVRQQLFTEYPGLDAVTWAACERVHRDVTDRTKKFHRTLRDLADPLDAILVAWLADQAAYTSRKCP